MVPDSDENVAGSSVKKLYTVGEFVTVLYRKRPYVGQINEYSEEMNEYYVNFMQKKKEFMFGPNAKMNFGFCLKTS